MHIEAGSYGQCRFCGGDIGPEPPWLIWWCRDGCKAMWNLAKAQKAVREAKHPARPVRDPEKYPLFED